MLVDLCTVLSTYVVLHGTPSALGVPYRINYVNYSHFGGIFKDTHFGHAASESCHLVC